MSFEQRSKLWNETADRIKAEMGSKANTRSQAMIDLVTFAHNKYGLNSFNLVTGLKAPHPSKVKAEGMKLVIMSDHQDQSVLHKDYKPPGPGGFDLATCSPIIKEAHVALIGSSPATLRATEFGVAEAIISKGHVVVVQTTSQRAEDWKAALKSINPKIATVDVVMEEGAVSKE